MVRINAIASQPAPENKTCRLLGAARDRHSMQAVDRVNTPKSSCFEHDLRANALRMSRGKTGAHPASSARGMLFRILLRAFPALQDKAIRNIPVPWKTLIPMHKCRNMWTHGRGLLRQSHAIL